MTESMTIGRFSRLSGLSIYALRHYDDFGLLHPAEVDERTGYRRYDPAQLTAARLIVELRWLDVPLEAIRVILNHPTSTDAHQLLARHQARLRGTRDHLTRQLSSVQRHLAKGIAVTPPTAGLAPVQIKLTTHDLEAARSFYRDAFGLEEQTVRHTEDADYSAFQFGTYGQSDFFLIHLLPSDGPDFDRPGPSTFGLLVEDLDEVHARALRAGAVEAMKPTDAEGMPRHSALRDPSGNWVWLYQS